MIMKMISITRTRSSCLFYSVITFFRLRKLGYYPEFVYSHYHFKVYVWTKNICRTYEFMTGVGHSSFIYMLFHFLPIFKGKIIISEENYGKI